MRRMKLRPHWLYLALFFLIAGGSGLIQAQAEAKVRITQVDTSTFPEMKVNVLAAAGDGTPLADLSSLQLSEDGTIVTDIQTSPVAVGIEVAFVIDANSTINQRDTGASQSRREQVRDSVVAFAQQNMSSSQLDRVHLVVPNAASDSPEFLTEASGAIFANEVINKINFYVPNSPKATPLSAMLTAAIEKLAASDGSHYRAIVLYTDGGLLDDQLDFEALVTQAQQNNIVFYAFILGSRADTNEINNVSALTQPTGGAYLHMPLPADSAPLYQSLAAFGQQTQVIYRSGLSSGGEHTIVVNVAGQVAESFVNLTVEAPTVQILLDNSQPIIRVASSADTPLADMEPVSQLIVAQVSWPDDHARSLAAATLLINGTEQAVIESPTVDGNNLLEFTWDISQLDAGEYELIIQVQDELSLISQSAPLAFRVEIEKPPLKPQRMRLRKRLSIQITRPQMRPHLKKTRHPFYQKTLGLSVLSSASWLLVLPSSSLSWPSFSCADVVPAHPLYRLRPA
ncbi:MAG: VWA domain-containing protein [Chloroflexi bacterium]|nr:VWA domain-containing protein [Chloroflexota bacterium]